jgi:cobalt transporter subunit CbtB
VTAKELSVASGAVHVKDRSINQRKALGIGALIVGCACIYLVGFAPNMTVHNAAHDTRHTAGYPCH